MSCLAGGILSMSHTTTANARSSSLVSPVSRSSLGQDEWETARGQGLHDPQRNRWLWGPKLYFLQMKRVRQAGTLWEAAQNTTRGRTHSHSDLWEWCPLCPNSPEPGYDPVQSNSLGVCEIKDELSCFFFLKTPNKSSRAKDLEVKLFYVSFGHTVAMTSSAQGIEPKNNSLWPQENLTGLDKLNLT